jgi:2-dehydro-3-deoxyphosphogluconate aldolase/(4S)-4-hydroxy-2-oxoglutarate aldolase
MTKPDIVHSLLRPGVIAILRADHSAGFMDALEALADGGIKAAEITFTTPGALDLITDAAARFGGRLCIGAGTVLDAETCRTAILAGAEYIITPVVRPEVIRMATRYGKPVACGAFTPTECLAAHEAGADFIKLFPAELAGPAGIRSILAPLPMLQIIPTGGVTPETASAFLKAGCVALGVGSSLVSREILENRDWATLRTRAEKFVEAVEAGRR